MVFALRMKTMDGIAMDRVKIIKATMMEPPWKRFLINPVFSFVKSYSIVYNYFVASVKPLLTVKFTPGLTFKLLTPALEFSTTVPLLMITSVSASGNALQLQLPGVSHALVPPLPVQEFTN
jgi:hypothetical protein